MESKLTGAQRAALRSLANGMEPIIHVGKEGVTENLLTQVADALEARELIKCTVQKSCDTDVRAICNGLCEELGAEGIQVIGRRFVLYRASEKNPRLLLQTK